MTTFRTVLTVVVTVLLLVAVQPLSAQIVRSGNFTVDLSTTQGSNPPLVKPFETDQELITNGGFETGSLSPWTSGAWTVVTNGPHTGTYCAYDIGNNYVTQSITPTPASSIASATLWMRQPEAQISAIDWLYQGGSYSEDLLWVTASWAQYNIATFIDPGTTIIGIRIWGYMGGPQGPDETFLDDISIQTAGGQSLDITLTPVNPPIIIPAPGGTFNFNISLSRLLPPQSPFYGWSRVHFPDGSYSPILMGPVQINPPVGVQVSRQRTQSVPGTWPAGLSYLVGYVNTTVTYPAIDADSIPFTKSTTSDGGPLVWDANCYGELFPGEQSQTAFIPSGLNLGVQPNPFNPTTTISFDLPEAVRVILNVYDVQGRLVATLVNGVRQAGTHQVTFDGSKLASGMYLYTLRAGQLSTTGKMLLLK